MGVNREGDAYMFLKDAYVGQSVSYFPEFGEKEIGVIKSLDAMEGHVYVVFHCGGEWHNFEDYTAQSTPLDKLEEGWAHVG